MNNKSRMDEIEQMFQTKFITDYSKYNKAKKVGIAKRILMHVRATDRAELNMDKYRRLYNEMKENIEYAKEIEKDIKTKNLTAEQKENLLDKREVVMEEVSANDKKMANAVVRAMKNQGYFGRARTEDFIANSKRLSKIKGSKRLRLQKSVLLRIISKLSPKSRKAEKEFAKDIKKYVMDSVDNLVGVDRNENLLHNPQMLENLNPRNVEKTIASQPDIPNLEPVTFEREAAPQPTPSNPPQTPSDNSNSGDFLSNFGKMAKEKNDTKVMLEKVLQEVSNLNKEVSQLKSQVNQMQTQREVELPLGATNPQPAPQSSENADPYTMVQNFDQPGATNMEPANPVVVNQNGRTADDSFEILNNLFGVEQSSEAKGAKK